MSHKYTCNPSFSEIKEDIRILCDSCNHQDCCEEFKLDSIKITFEENKYDYSMNVNVICDNYKKE